MDRKMAFFYGIIAGVATIAYYLLFYFIQPRLFFHLGVQWSALLIFLGFMLLAGRQERRSVAGKYPWQLALRTVFTVYVFATLVYNVFYFILFNYADPGLALIQEEVLLENLDKYQGLLGVRNAENLRRDLEDTGVEYAPGVALMALARSIIGGFILSLPLAFMLKKE